MGQLRSDVTKEHIERIAEALFAERGYEATGVDEICKSAGFSKGAFYHHYASKHELFMILLDHWLDGLDLAMANLSGEQKTVPDKILSMADIIPVIIETAQSKLGILLEFWTQARRDRQIWDAAAHPYQKYEKFFTGMIEQGMAEGSIQPGDARLLAQKIISLVIGVLFQAFLAPDGQDWKRVCKDGIKAMLINGGG